MAISTFQRIIVLETFPLALRQVQAMFRKFFGRVDSACYFSPDFLTRLNLSNDLVRPFVRDVAIRASSAHTRSIAVVNALGVGRVNVIFHLVTGNAKFFGVGGRHRPVKHPHIGDTRKKEKCGDNAQRYGASATNRVPIPGQE